MTVEHVELKGSRSGSDATDRSGTAELTWTVWGSSNLDTVRDHIVGYVPSTFDGLIYKSLTWEPLGGGAWTFTAQYVHPDRADRNATLDVGDYTFSFDTTGGTVQRQYSLATTANYAKSGETAPTWKGAIGVKGNEVEGVEIGIPALKFSIRRRFARTAITLAYVKQLMDMTYTTNSDVFMGFAPGELLFIGASGQQGIETDPEVTFNFIASPNVTGLTIGDITGIAKKGHEYLWVYFEGIEDATANMTVRQPKSVHIEQVYGTSAFGTMGI